MSADLGTLLDALRGVTWPARRAALAGTAGTHHSRLRGLTAEFTEYRPYRQGDDPRRLDWKLLARTDRAYLRITSDRATLATVLLVDASRSMAFPESTAAKWRTATHLAVGLASVAHASGDPAGLVVPAAGGVARVAPLTRRGVIGEMVRVLSAVTPEGTAPLAPTLAALRGTPRVAVLTDLLGDEAELRTAARELTAGGTEVHCIHVVAREELDPAGAFLATDPERPDLQRPFVDETRERYQAAFAAWRADTARAWRAAGAVFTGVVTDEPPARAVRRVTGSERAS